MISAIIAGIGALAAGMVIVKHWREITTWLREFIFVLKGIFSTTLKSVAHAARVFLKGMQEGMAAVMHRLYYQEEGEWVEEIRTRKISQDQLPDWAKEKIGIQEANISQEIERELQLTL